MAKNRETTKKANELKNIIFRDRLEQCLNSTVCFFHDDENGNIAPFGSGVLIKYKDHHYVVTAAHVLAENYNELFVLLNEKDVEMTLGGAIISSPMPESGNRDDDKMDISILRLDPRIVPDVLSQFTPIGISEIELNHKMNEFGFYFAVGFPLTRTKIKRNEIQSLAWTYQSTPLFEFQFERFGFNASKNISIKYDRNVTSAKNPDVHYSPNPRGMSGCGLWHFKSKDEKYLIGIIIENVTETNNKSLVATKIDVVLNMIDNNWY